MNFVSKLFSPRYLLYTNVALGSSFYAVGDFSEQQLHQTIKRVVGSDSKPAPSYDQQRTVAMARTGVCLGLVGHYWYKLLDHRWPGTSGRTLIKKLLLEMAAGPPFALLTFICLGMFEKKPLNISLANFKDNFAMICLADWGFYVPLQFFNFKLVPPKYRFLYVACITVIYDTFLSFVLHNKDKSH